MTLRTPILAGNWKLNHTLEETRRFLKVFLEQHPARPDATVILFPTALALSTAREAAVDRPDILFGVQNIYWESNGAFTGEISAPLAREAGAAFALVGHSERRHVFGESPQDTARKVDAALAGGLSPVLCVGETLEEREAGNAAAVVEEQLRAVFGALRAEEAERMLVAYEPVWAIGTGRTASPEDAAEMHARIRSFLAGVVRPDVAATTPILYGGSVKPENVAELLAAGDVDGVLVGGASLDPAGFARICAAVPA